MTKRSIEYCILYFSAVAVNRKDNYLHIFGLKEPFTEEELSGSFRALAKLNHPDVNDDPAAEMRMVILNEGYTFLKDFAADNDIFQKPSSGSDDYSLYRQAVDILRDGFDSYYEGHCDLNSLKEYLARAKTYLSRIIKEYHTSEWYSDSVDRICSINKWLD